MKRIIKILLDAVFPPQCINCGKKISSKDSFASICGNCFKSIEINSGFSCPKCGKRLYFPKNDCHAAEKFVLAAAVSYKDKKVHDIIHFLKYKYLKSAAAPLAEMLKLYFEKISVNSPDLFENYLFLPLPLHPKKEKERGFNQTLLIANELLKNSALNFRIEKSVLFKTKNAKPQVRLGAEERKENVKNCFAVKNENSVKNKNIILFDDVFTSGATMREAVRVLKEAGAKKIIGLVIARA